MENVTLHTGNDQRLREEQGSGTVLISHLILQKHQRITYTAWCTLKQYYPQQYNSTEDNQ